MRVGRRKILLRNLILIFLASHFTRRMSFQIFIMNLNISSFFFMAKHSALCVVVERCGKWRAKEIRNAFKRFFQHAISWSYRFFSSQFFFIQLFFSDARMKFKFFKFDMWSIFCIYFISRHHFGYILRKTWNFVYFIFWANVLKN